LALITKFVKGEGLLNATKSGDMHAFGELLERVNGSVTDTKQQVLNEVLGGFQSDPMKKRLGRFLR